MGERSSLSCGVPKSYRKDLVVEDKLASALGQ